MKWLVIIASLYVLFRVYTFKSALGANATWFEALTKWLQGYTIV